MREINPYQQLIIELFGDLSPRDEQILRLRFLDHMTQEAVGKIYNIDKERIRQLENRALGKLNVCAIEIAKIKQVLN